MKDFDLLSYHISTGVYEEILTLLRFVKSPPIFIFSELDDNGILSSKLSLRMIRFLHAKSENFLLTLEIGLGFPSNLNLNLMLLLFICFEI
jgi:hypothetical protein